MNNEDILQHHGILGMHWGVRRYQPYRYGDRVQGGKEVGDATKVKKRAFLIAGGVTLAATAAYVAKNKHTRKYVDDVIKSGTKLNRISGDPDEIGKRTVYATLNRNKFDKLKYEGMYGIQKKLLQGEKPYKISMDAVKDIKVASNKNASKIFKNISKDPEIDDTLSKIINSGMFGRTPDQRRIIAKARKGDSDALYEVFNMSLTVHGDNAKIMGIDPNTMDSVQNKFYKALKDAGYGAINDINDLKYSGYNAKQPLIVFDKESIVKNMAKEMDTKEIIPKGLLADQARKGEYYVSTLGIGSVVYGAYPNNEDRKR